jgi:hypothetical protein
MRRVRVTIVATYKSKISIYSECVFVTLVIQHSLRMRRVLLPSVASPDLQLFPLIISQTALNFEKR